MLIATWTIYSLIRANSVTLLVRETAEIRIKIIKYRVGFKLNVVNIQSHCYHRGTGIIIRCEAWNSGAAPKLP